MRRRRVARPLRHKPIRAGSRHTTTKTSMLYPGCCRASCTNTFIMCTRTAGGRTIWAMKCPIARARSNCSTGGSTNSMPAMTGGLHTRYSWRCGEQSWHAIFRNSPSLICCGLFGKIKPSSAMRTGKAFLTIAGIRRIRWGGSSCMCAAIEMLRGNGYRTLPAPRCNWRISGRTFRAIWTRGGFTFRSAWRQSTGSRSATSSRGDSTNATPT